MPRVSEGANPEESGVNTQPINEEYDYSSSDEDEGPSVPIVVKSRKPGNNAFRQQRLKAYNPVLTTRSIVPILMIIAIIFAPLGAAMWYASHRIQDITIEYSHCENLASSDYWSQIPEKYYTYHTKTKGNSINAPQWKLSKDQSQRFDDEKNVCSIQFDVPNDIKGPIYFFYRLHNFYQNHRRYAKSFSEDQIQGKRASVNDIKNTVGQNCQPLSVDHNGKIIYPCGLIANSLFNDTYSSTLQGVNGTSFDYKMTDKGISWKSDQNRYKKTKYNYTEIVPPPNWYKMFPEGYNATNVPDVSSWGQFHNWMKTSAFPDFSKLALRNDHDTLSKGIYEITIGLHFPVNMFHGKKYVYISQRSVIGGKNDFLGICWMVGGALCFVLGLGLLIINFIKPRRTGDVSLLSWNKSSFEKDQSMKSDVKSESAETFS